jgi:uncharacterized SAM-binding protein YcdF (DUF218 family)
MESYWPEKNFILGSMEGRGSTGQGPADREGRAAAAARTIWDWLRVGGEPGRADIILVLGSSDVRPAERGARLFLEGRAPLLVLSGGRGRYTGTWPRPEAEIYAEAAERLGVPRTAMVLEDRSTNTGENIIFTRRLLEGRGIDPRRIILVQVPFMERRALATVRRYWPGKDVRPTSPPISFDGYPAGGLDRSHLILRLAGEVQRMLEYPRLGFQAPDEVPGTVVAAWRELRELGYDGDFPAAG